MLYLDFVRLVQCLQSLLAMWFHTRSKFSLLSLNTDERTILFNKDVWLEKHVTSELTYKYIECSADLIVLSQLLTVVFCTTLSPANYFSILQEHAQLYVSFRYFTPCHWIECLFLLRNSTNWQLENWNHHVYSCFRLLFRLNIQENIKIRIVRFNVNIFIFKCKSIIMRSNHKIINFVLTLTC